MKIRDIESHTNYTTNENEPMIVYPPEIKKGFVKKVYSILALQLLFTTSLCAATVSVKNMHPFILDTNVFAISLMTTIGSVCAIGCFGSKYPWNILLLSLFTVAESVIISRLCLLYFLSGHGEIIIMSAGITSLDFIILTGIAFFSKRDFSFMENMLSIGIFSLIGFMILQMFIASTFLNIMIGWFGVMLFSGYILYDTSQILHRLGPDDAIHASLMLYLDIINIFILLLDLIRSSSD